MTAGQNMGCVTLVTLITSESTDLKDFLKRVTQVQKYLSIEASQFDLLILKNSKKSYVNDSPLPNLQFRPTSP